MTMAESQISNLSSRTDAGIFRILEDESGLYRLSYICSDINHLTPKKYILEAIKLSKNMTTAILQISRENLITVSNFAE